MEREADSRQRTRVQKARDRLCCPPLITCGLAERRPKTICECEWKEELVFVVCFFMARSMFALQTILLAVVLLITVSLCTYMEFDFYFKLLKYHLFLSYNKYKKLVITNIWARF